MITYTRLLVVAAFASFLLTGVHARAALSWPAPAVKSLQLRIQKGLCSSTEEDKLTRDICATYGIKEKSKAPKITLSKPNPSLLIFERSGQVTKVERGETESEFVINRVKIDAASAKTQTELKGLIEGAMRNKTAKLNLFIEAAYAAPLDPEIPALIQQLVAETHQLANCSLYTDFGNKCVEGMKKVFAEIEKKKNERSAAAKDPNGFVQMQGRASELTQLTFLNGHLAELQDRLENTLFPSLQGYDTVRMCAAKKNPQDIDRTQKDAEAALKDCRQKVAEAVEKTGGSRESRQTESTLSRMFNRLMGRTTAATPSTNPVDAGEDTRQ
mgnify:CR=1 FL=1